MLHNGREAMKLTIKINLDNAAFDINEDITHGEVRRLLTECAEDIQMTVNVFKNLDHNEMPLDEYSESITEVNGNKCGNYKVKL